MPANLPPQYLKVEDEYRSLTKPGDRLEKLRELYRMLPKHKGTEKLQSDLKQKMSRLKEELETAAPGAKKQHGGAPKIPREGAGRVVLVGPPNSGKSALLAALTNARPAVAPFPFTTRAPQPGILDVEDVPIQLLDLPPVSDDFMEPWLPGLIGSADAAILTFDLASDDAADEVEAVLALLAARGIELVEELPCDVEDVEVRHVKTVAAAAKADAPGAEGRLEVLREWFAGRFRPRPVSAETREGLETLARDAYHSLGLIRIFTKVPGRPADRSRPFTVPVGSTVLDLAREIHRDLEASLRSAKVWGTGVFDGQSVKRDHELHDRDVVELHAS
ncbi:GTPase [Paludisphaera soli]|uniref:GTPase n=1 Tax=Paludisphaera soli TaxID=2712865 RepID=UPI0013EC9553|nr:GTPase [Paludisphaera soli]